MDKRWQRCAVNPATKANKIDFNRIAGSTAATGIPNKRELIIGEKTAVSSPTFHPYL